MTTDVSYERRWETRQGELGGRPVGATDFGYERRPQASRDANRGRSVADETRESYYGTPVIHKPQWNWLIVLYFFLGGISGASYAIASIARLFSDTGSRRIARAGRYLAFATLLPSPVLLILDLGRPDRFHHMLRIFKVRSPLSVGSWLLTIFGGLCTLSAFYQAAQDGLLGRNNPLARLGRALPERATGMVGLGPAFAFSGYTGTLLAATAVPLWTKRALVMGPLFLASALSNAGAAISLILVVTRGGEGRTLRRLERLDTFALLSELALLFTFRAGLGPVIARPLVTGRLGWIFRLGVLGAGAVVPLTLQAASLGRGHAPSRAATGLASTFTLLGGLLFRYVILYAGRASADDPQATFALTRGDVRRNG